MTEKESKKKRLSRKLIFLPYFIGLFWTCLHPIVSVLTGELKCRGWFLDESAIESRSVPQSPATIQLPKGSSSLCEILNSSNAPRDNVWCSSHDRFEIASLVPVSNAIDPTDEAIVLIVPSPSHNNNWQGDSFHYSLTQTINKFADPVATPWLAKTVILVSPSSSQISDKKNSSLLLEETLSIFLDAYLGSKSSSSAVPPLPPRYSQAILRQLIVVDLEDHSIVSTRKQTGNSPPQSDFSILPQGKRGALPNLDMVTLVGKLYQQASFLNHRLYPSSTFLAHGYTQTSKDWKSIFRLARVGNQKPTKLERKAQLWANEMIDLGLFAYTLAAGPHPPHWPALDRGIDSLTIKLKLSGIYRKDPNIETVQRLEHVIRALSNLHERLHHSFVLYWLPSPAKFVSHMEYFLPCVLLIVPVATRAFGMVLVGDLPILHLTTIGLSVLVSLGSMGIMGLATLVDDGTRFTNTCLVVLYVGMVTFWKWTFHEDAAATNKKRRSQSLQFAACATAAYLLVPIAFCHSALVYLPAMVLVPLLAFPDYGYGKKRWMLLGFWIFAAPPVLLVPWFFSHYTIFVRYAYIPLHIQSLLLILQS